MTISRYNYEEYFLLYIDNELDAAARKSVEDFAAENPDLGEELELLKQSVIKPEKHLVFTNKEALLKSPMNTGLVNDSNYEEYFVLYTDDELDAAQKAMVESYVYEHPERHLEFELFLQAKLQPEKLECNFKDKLYKKERKAIPLWWRMSAAAAVMLLAGWFWLNQQSTGKNDSISRENTKTSQPASKQQPRNITRIEDAGINGQGPINSAQPNTEPVIANNNNVNPATSNSSAPSNKVKAINRFVPAVNEPNQQLAVNQPEIDPARKPINTNTEFNASVDITRVKPDAPAALPTIAVPASPDEANTEDNTIVSFASNNESENVFLTNIPVDNNVPLRSFLRKASRVINKVTALKHSNRAGISIGNVEIAIQ